MEFQGKNKQTMLCFSFVTSLSILGYFLCAATEDMHYDSQPTIVEEVHVGVILHMESREGKIIHSCITTALSDFYQMHNNYTTRVILHTRDSKAKPLYALSAGEPFHTLLVFFTIFSSIISKSWLNLLAVILD